MREIRCSACGSTEFLEKDGIRKCQYCGTEYKISIAEYPLKSPIIDLSNDVETLLQKCKRDPAHARRYANLILDIDPMNDEARKYLE